jgi:hypothetical protein
MKTIQFIAEASDGAWLARWKIRAMPSVIRVQVLFLYLVPVMIAGFIAPFDAESAITLAILLYAAILFKGGFSPGRKLANFESRRAWSRLSDRAKLLVLGPRTVTIDLDGIHMESTLSHVFWRWEAIDRVISMEEGILFALVTDPTEPRIYVPVRAFADQAQMQAFFRDCAQEVQNACERQKAVRIDDSHATDRATPLPRSSPGASTAWAVGKGMLVASAAGFLFLLAGMVVVAAIMLFMVWRMTH